MCVCGRCLCVGRGGGGGGLTDSASGCVVYTMSSPLMVTLQ